MARFVEYFSIIGISKKILEESERDAVLEPKILQRLPPNDWNDFIFPAQLSDVSNPMGWEFSRSPKTPIFFSNALTDFKGARCYYASFIFYEYISIQKMYAPKALTVVSRIPYYDNFKDCLSIIFKYMYIWSVSGDSSTLLKIISNLVYNKYDSLQGSAEFRLALSDSTVTVHPSSSLMIPTTGDCVYVLLKLVGVHNLITLYSAILLDSKIVFISKSLTYLYKCALGIISIIYPLNFMYVFIPILPKTLGEMLNVPTPYVIGVHSSCEIDLSEFNDVLIMNLDTGYLFMNEELKVPLIPEIYYKEIQKILISYAQPDAGLNDRIFYDKIVHDQYIIDKHIRACFFYIGIRLLTGYRPCTTYARLVPTPVMKFHPSLFMTRRNIKQSDFYSMFLRTTAFYEFISDRGSTYRVTDYFDEMSYIFEFDYQENVEDIYKYVDIFAKYFIKNEPACDPKNRRPCVDYQAIFSKIDLKSLNIPDLDLSQISMPSDIVMSKVPPVIPKNRVMYDLSTFQHDMIYYINPRRKKMITECIELLFQNQISEASKMMYSIELSLNSKACQFELFNAVLRNQTKQKMMLSNAQISMFARLFNSILKHSDDDTCYSTAVQVLEISSKMCQSGSEVTQFLYLHLQEHKIWRNIDFWVNYYFYETQAFLTKMYERSNPSLSDSEDIKCDQSELVFHPQLKATIDALEMTADIISNFERLLPGDRSSNEQAELAFIFSQTIEFIYKMAYVLIDYESIKLIAAKGDSKKDSSLTIQAKLKEEKLREVENFINKFLMQINSYICLEIDRMNELEELIKHVLQQQYDLIEKICSLKSKSLSSELSTKFKPVCIYENEVVLSDMAGFLFFSVPKSEYDYDQLGSLSLLPAQGVLYLTNYRIGFIGQPIEPFLSDYLINMSLPKKSLHKLKVKDVPIIELSDGHKFNVALEIKTRICHVIQFALPLGSTNDSLDNFKKHFRSACVETKKLSSQKQDHMTLKKELLPKSLTKITQSETIHVNPNRLSNYSALTLSRNKNKSHDSFSKFDSGTLSRRPRNPELSRTLERKSNYKDTLIQEFTRMNIIKKDAKTKGIWRVSTINNCKNFTPNLPDDFIVPLFIQDDLYLRLIKYYRRRRIPVSTYVFGAEHISPDYAPRMFALFRSEAPIKAISPPTAAKLSSKAGEIYHILNGMTNTLENCRGVILKGQSLIECLRGLHPEFQKIEFLNSLEMHSMRIVPMYIFYDRNFTPSNSFDKMTCIHLDTLSVGDVKKSFLEFSRAFCPVPLKGKSKDTYWEIIANSKWLRHVRQAITIGAIAAFMGEVFCSGSYFSFGDGVDMTSAVMCLAQILLDPHYRTIAGFQTLIQKEWIEFNYNFYGKNFIDFMPVFILFLDCVYQITQQFPHAFEFNTYYLNFIAFHNFSDRFHNFQHGDASIEPVTDETADTASVNIEITPISKTSSTEPGFTPELEVSATASCIFSFISKYVESSTVFVNPYYDPNFTGLIHPSLELCCYDIWPFYYVNNFQLYCMYNLETLPSTVINTVQSGSEIESKQQKLTLTSDIQVMDNIHNLSQLTMTYSYMGDGSPFVMDSISWLLHDIMVLNDELGNSLSCITAPIAKLEQSYFKPQSLISPENFDTFLNYISLVYKMTEPIKNIKNEGDKMDPNLHDLTGLECFYPCSCIVCGLNILETKDMLHCTKCSVFMHQKCQIYSNMICLNNLRSVQPGKSAESLETYPVAQTFQLVDDELMLHGVLYTKKMLSSWTPKHYVFNKKSQILNIYNTIDITSIPIQSYTGSDISNCKELKSLPSNAPKDLQHVAGAFELKIKKKTEIFLTPKKSDASVWYRTLSKFTGF